MTTWAILKEQPNPAYTVGDPLHDKTLFADGGDPPFTGTDDALQAHMAALKALDGVCRAAQQTA